MNSTSIFSIFTFLWIILVTITQPAQCDNKMIVVADEGEVWQLFYPLSGSAEDRMRVYETQWQDYAFTLQVEHAVGGSTISGEVQHGYGDGVFDVELRGDDLIQDASITPFASHTAFTVTLSDTIPPGLTSIFTVKPIPNFDVLNIEELPTSENSYLYYQTNREGADELPFQWKFITVTDQSGQEIGVDPRLNEKRTWYDVLLSLQVRTSGFVDEVVYVGIHEIQYRISSTETQLAEHYIPLNKIQENVFRKGFLTGAFANDRPITLEVRLANGESYFITTNETAGEVLITPTTDVEDWMEYGD